MQYKPFICIVKSANFIKCKMKDLPKYSYLDRYKPIVGSDTVDKIKELSERIGRIRVVHVNSTRLGGGVAEILHKLIPLKNDIGLETTWEVVTGEDDYYRCTKSFHNAIQGNNVKIEQHLLDTYENTIIQNAVKLRPQLESADIVFIHDPQPCALREYVDNTYAKWIWRCHIDASSPGREVWDYLTGYIEEYDGSIFSTTEFLQPLSHRQYIITPSIDPLSEKNEFIENGYINSTYERFGIDPERPVISQVSRYDRFKDPVGVIKAYRIVKKTVPELQLVLAGGDAADDPEGAEVLKEVRSEANGDGDIHTLLLPPDANKTINAIQRMSDIVIQKSLREGFGLTVTEGLWKEKPVIGGNTGGIRTQIIDNENGFLVDSVEDAASKIEYLLQNPGKSKEFGQAAKEHVRHNFLITRHLLDYLELINEYTS